MAFRMKIVVAYLGAPFHGWQRQRGQRTVQGELERALSKCVGGSRITIMGAGRTDAGVHASGQTAHCDLPGCIPPEKLVSSLNARLPLEIRVRSARPAGPGFHAQKSALGKLYTYRLRWRERDLPWLDPRSAVIKPVADMDALTTALTFLSGCRDWASFTVTNPASGSTVRTLYAVRMKTRRSGLHLEFVGDGFLRYQVRRMVGVLLEVGRRKKSLADLRSLLEDPSPGASIQTAPATGLCLEKVYYGKPPFASLRSQSQRSEEG